MSDQTDFNNEFDPIVADSTMTTVNPDYQDQVKEQRRLVALDMASKVSNNIDDLINNATRIENWLVDNSVNNPKSDEGTNEFWIGDENTAV